MDLETSAKEMSILQNLFNCAMGACLPNLQSEVISLHCNDMLKGKY